MGSIVITSHCFRFELSLSHTFETRECVGDPPCLLRRWQVRLSAAKLVREFGAAHEEVRPGQPPHEANTGLRGDPGGICLRIHRRENQATWRLAREDARESARNHT